MSVTVGPTEVEATVTVVSLSDLTSPTVAGSLVDATNLLSGRKVVASGNYQGLTQCPHSPLHSALFSTKVCALRV